MANAEARAVFGIVWRRRSSELSGDMATAVRWDSSIVPATTLDELIAAYGIPAFVKIDVEGMEHEVLAGLSQPVP